MKKIYLIVLFTIFAVLTLTACGADNAEITSKPKPVTSSGVIAEGRLLPLNSLDQSFTLAGKVAEEHVADGDEVEAGGVLASLEVSPEAALALARAREEVLAAEQALEALQASADLNLAQAELSVINPHQAYETAQAAFDVNKSDENKAGRDLASAQVTLAQELLTRIESENGIDPDALAAAEARLASAQAGLESELALVAAHELKASLDGTVIDQSLQPGQMVGAGVPVMVIADLSARVVHTDNLSETQIAMVEVGDAAEVVLDALPGLKLSGEVTHINGRYEEKRGDVTYTVTILVNELDPRMRWGMTSAVHFLP